jgi:hypothetical protein
MAKTKDGHYIIKNVRCSFPQLWHEDDKGNGDVFSRSITILLDPEDPAHAAHIAEIKGAIADVMKDKPKIAAVVKKKPERVCLRPGDRDEFPDGHKMVKATSRNKILVLHKNGTKATEDDDPIYSGCRVNVKLDFWGQDNQYGKRINATVLAVQFAGDDESFDGAYVSEETAADGFESLDDLDDGFAEETATEEDTDFLD